MYAVSVLKNAVKCHHNMIEGCPKSGFTLGQPFYVISHHNLVLQSPL